MTCLISLTILTNMTTGEFWNKVAVLANVFDGRVTAGPMSTNWMKRELRNPQPYFQLGQACEMQLMNAIDTADLTLHAHRLGLYVEQITPSDRNVVIQPEE